LVLSYRNFLDDLELKQGTQEEPGTSIIGLSPRKLDIKIVSFEEPYSSLCSNSFKFELLLNLKLCQPAFYGVLSDLVGAMLW